MRRALVLLIAAAALVGATEPALARASWKQRLDRVVAGRRVGVAVAWRGELLYGYRARVRRPPASNQKLLLSMALLDELGPSARLETRVLARRSPSGVVSGNLYVVGRGDPAIAAGGAFARGLAFEPTWIGRLARRIAAAGITRVRGGVVGSTGFYRRDWAAPGWRPEFRRLYVALPTALTYQGNTHKGRHVLDPERRLARSLTRRLQRFGVSVDGQSRAGRVPRVPRTVARVQSRPLRILLRHTNRASSNFFAEVLGKRLAVERFGPPGSITLGARAIGAWARARSVRIAARDSSGLSYANRISPRALVRLLYQARRAPWGRALRRSLPAAGQGTLNGRLAGVRLRAKTGTLERVSALSGWVRQRRLGRWIEFSVLSTGLRKDRAAALEDRIVRVLSRVGPAPRVVSTLAHPPLA
jgi:D-alanyl-D-alanine carboxypeptidase/D-alanyl-D-alanine-endopeptidase (penicillin-binding protein 4)